LGSFGWYRLGIITNLSAIHGIPWVFSLYWLVIEIFQQVRYMGKGFGLGLGLGLQSGSGLGLGLELELGLG
jgi:hypothetical protein